MKFLWHGDNIVYVPDNISVGTHTKSDIMVQNIPNDPYPVILAIRKGLAFPPDDPMKILEYNADVIKRENQLVSIPSGTVVSIVGNGNEMCQIGYTDREYKFDPFSAGGMYRSTCPHIDMNRIHISSWKNPEHEIYHLQRGPIHIYGVYKKGMIEWPIVSVKCAKEDIPFIDAWTHGPLAIPAYMDYMDIIPYMLSTKPLLKISEESPYRDIIILSRIEDT